jgi:hypothetical protein
MFDTLKDLLQMPQCTPTQHNNEKNILQWKERKYKAPMK